MKQKFLLLVALLALAVNIAVAGNYVPGNGLKFIGKSEKAEFAATLQTDKSIKANRSHKKGAAIMRKSADEGWGEWEAFAPGGSNDAVWTLTAWQTGTLNVKTYVRTSTADATKKQIKCAGWGAGLFTAAGVDILLDWNTTDNTIEIPMQSTGYYVSNYNDYAVLGTFRTGKYNPDQGKFTFYVGYSVPQYYVMVQGFGFGDETLQMAGNFKDYSLSFSRGTVDDAATPIKQTVNVYPGADITSYRVHVDTYENYAAAQGSAAYFEALAKADGTDYTTPSATVELQGSAYNIYVVVVSAFADGEMKNYDYGVYEVSPASDWETIGVHPYREDIVTSLYNFQVTGPVYNVEVQKHKTYRDIYRIKNPYGSTSPFGSYTLYENAYLYLNAQDSAKVTPTFQLSNCDLGIDIDGGMPLNVYLADKTVGGTYDGYVISFPKKALVSNNYYVNANGLFRAVINFRDTEFAFADDAKSVYTGETVKIISNNTFSTPTFESLTPEIATVDAKGVVTAVAPGKAQIKVVQAAALEFNAREAVMEIDVENPTITPSKHDYTITAYLPQFCDAIAAYADSVRVMGGFDNWTNGIWMEKKIDEDFNDCWYAEIKDVEEGTEFKLRFGTDADWAVQVQLNGQNLGNEKTGETTDIVLRYDGVGYGFAACGAPVPGPTVDGTGITVNGRKYGFPVRLVKEVK